MNNIYTILGLGLLSAAALSSCQQEEIFKGENNGKLPEGTLSTIATISDYTPENGNSRANVQDDGKTFYWNTDDKVTIWDGTKAIEFSATNYNESNPSNNVEFTATGEFADGATVWGIYPSKRTEVTAENVFSFTLPDEITQNADGKPHLNETMFMMAEGKVSGQTVTNLNFKHLTSVFHFTIQNNTSDNYVIKSIEVQAFNADGSTPANVFPKELKINGTEKTYSSLSNTLSLKLNDITLAYSNKTTAYLSFFPSQGLTADSKLKILAKVNKNSEEESELVLKEGNISELYKDKSLTTTDNNNYVEGKRYGVTSAIINPEDMGYIDNGDGVYTIITAQGLVNVISSGLFSTATEINLQNDLDMSEIETSIEPISSLTCTFNGNSKKIIGLSLEKANLFDNNAGIIKNIIFESLTINSTDDSNTNVGLVGTNNGEIDGVKINNISLTAKGKYVGGLVGTNNKTIKNSTVESGVMNITLTAKSDAAAGLVGYHAKTESLIQDCATGASSKNNKLEINIDGNSLEVYSGGLVGYTPNAGNAPVIKGSSVFQNVIIVVSSISNTSNTGGLIGWHACGNIIACMSLADITAQHGNIGGLIGQSQAPNAKKVTLCYSSGSVSKGDDGTAATNMAGLVGKTYNTGVTYTSCYTTTTINPDGATAAAIQANASGATSPTYSNCYFTQDNVSQTTISGLTPDCKKSIEELKQLVTDMNNAASTDGCNDYQFVENDSETEPLVIQKKQ